MQRGDLVLAEQKLRGVSDPEAIGMLAVVLDQEKKYTEADDAYRRALARHPQSVPLLNNFGNHLLAQGKLDAAAATFTKVLQLQPTHANATRQLAAIASEFAAQKRFDDAQAAFEYVLQRQPANWNVLYAAGLAASHAGHNSRARELLQRAVDQKPGNANALYDLAVVDIQMGDTNRALDLLGQAFRIAPNTAEITKLYAETSVDLGDYERALPAWQHYAKAAPDDAVGLYGLGAAESASAPDLALKHLNQALAMRPDLTQAYIARGLLLYRQGNAQAAADDFKLAAAREPDNARVLDRLGQAYLALDKPEQAVAVLRRAAIAAPNDEGVLLHLGRALSKAGNEEESKAVFARMRELQAKRSDRRLVLTN
jgi:tetratricopeptide (TPR) repeat protein